MDLKRSFDIAASATGLAVLSPVFAIVAAATALKFRRNPFFLVDRAGRGGKPFRIMKFRSMPDTADARGKLMPDESRSTAFGRFLRFTSIDELPQLVNILKGDMSFVGPRPRKADLSGRDAIPEGYRDILSVRPGLTGVWQLYAIGRTTRSVKQKKLEMDAAYVRDKPTLGKDILIILKSLPAFVLGHDAEPLFGKNKKKALSAPSSGDRVNPRSPVQPA